MQQRFCYQHAWLVYTPHFELLLILLNRVITACDYILVLYDLLFVFCDRLTITGNAIVCDVLVFSYLIAKVKVAFRANFSQFPCFNFIRFMKKNILNIAWNWLLLKILIQTQGCQFYQNIKLDQYFICTCVNFKR